MIRPPDPQITTPTLAYAPYSSAEATRRICHLAFRDAHTALDLTWSKGNFWRDPLPPGLTVTGNQMPGRPQLAENGPYSHEKPTCACGCLHVDFTDSGLPSASWDLICYDPPHVADAGADSIMGRRFGTVKGTAALRELIEAGAREAWRLARVGVLVKVADHCHGGQLHRLSDWIVGVIPQQPYLVLHTYRPTFLRDGKWRVQRAPRSNGAVWLAYRRDTWKHKDWDRQYARQIGTVA